MTRVALLLALSFCALSDAFFLDLIIPASRRGRATVGPLPVVGTPEDDSAARAPSLRMGSSDGEESSTNLLKGLIESVMRQVTGSEEEMDNQAAEAFLEIEEEQPEIIMINEDAPFDTPEEEAAYIRKYGYERNPSPRNVDNRFNAGFGAAMQAASSLQDLDNQRKFLPQLAEFSDPDPPFMNLLGVGNRGRPRQAVTSEGGDPSFVDLPDSSDDEVRCIPKVMQIEETVYDRAIKCHHSYQEKCHMTYITDYRSTTEQKCETTFKKNCHITFKPMPFNDTVSVCHTPVVRQCGTDPVGPEICSTHYETNCETRYKTYEIEQDEPVCKMEIMRKCENLTLPIPPELAAAAAGAADPADAITNLFRNRNRFRRQADDNDNGDDDSDTNNDPGTTVTADLTATQDAQDAGDDDNAVDNGDDNGDNTDALPPPPSGLTLDQTCEEWPVQQCTLEKRTVKKVHPDTACRKIPREVCIPNNCAMVQGEEICRDEVRMQVQNVPQEECELQPEENCHMEAVLVPRLVPKPNCVKVPKEICVNTKKNPRRVKKPVVKEWCYRPKDLIENPGSFPDGLLDQTGNGDGDDGGDDGQDESSAGGGDEDATPRFRGRK